MRVASAVLAVMALLATGPARGEEAPRPNILVVFSDDHAEQAVSAYGSRVNVTPHLDRLAAAGARFTNSFVTNSMPSSSGSIAASCRTTWPACRAWTTRWAGCSISSTRPRRPGRRWRRDSRS